MTGLDDDDTDFHYPPAPDERPTVPYGDAIGAALQSVQNDLLSEIRDRMTEVARHTRRSAEADEAFVGLVRSAGHALRNAGIMVGILVVLPVASLGGLAFLALVVGTFRV